jgi:hypothetical protein
MMTHLGLGSKHNLARILSTAGNGRTVGNLFEKIKATSLFASLALPVTMPNATLASVFASNRGPAGPIAAPAEVPTRKALPVTDDALEKVQSFEGDWVWVRSVRYADGSRVRHPIQIQLQGLPLPVVVTLLDPVIPAIRAEILWPPEGRTGPFRPTEPPPFLDFVPESPFFVRVRQIQGMTKDALLPEALLLPYLQESPPCAFGEWKGLVQIKGAFLDTNLEEKREEAFQAGGIVCVEFRLD